MYQRGLPFAVLLLAAAPLPSAAQSTPAEIIQAWARATPGKAENGAVYLTLEAPSGDRLTGLSTPVAKKAELHSMTMEGGIMKMRPLAGLDLPAGQTVTLKPGGAHIMLAGLAEPLRPGQSFPLTLQFEKAGMQQVSVTITASGAAAPASATGGGMKMPADR